MRRIAAVRFEIAFAAAMLLTMAGVSAVYGLRISLPAGEGGAWIAGQVALAWLVIALWAVREARAGRSPVLIEPMVAVICYALVVIVHFNLKLWTPYVRPVTYDALFWRIDQFARPVVDACMALRGLLVPVIRYDSGYYLSSLFVMFYMSLAYHAARTPQVLRKLFLSILLMQGIGGISYYLMPALGPFIYQDGVNPILTSAQHGMLTAHRAAVAAGPPWLIGNGAGALFGGLGAMPSLHAASSYLLVWFAWRHGRILLPTYVPLFAYILVNAVASRWHYLIDLPAGIVLAHLCILLACRLDDRAVGTKRAGYPLWPAGPLPARAWRRWPRAGSAAPAFFQAQPVPVTQKVQLTDVVDA